MRRLAQDYRGGVNSAITLEQWAALRAEAISAMERAYAPYSSFPVGAAARVVTDDDVARIVSGCNVENTSYGLTLCAECGVVSALYASGGGVIHAMYIVDGRGEILLPCGRCRQLIVEHATVGCEIMTSKGAAPITELLPQAFHLPAQP